MEKLIMDKYTNNRNHVMIVDDDPSVRFMMGSVLESLGMSFDEAEDGEQALMLLENVLPDLLLLDVSMPGMDGFEVCARMKKMPGISEIPIVMVTGSDDLPSIQRAFDLGVTDVITKPVPWPLIGFRISFLMQATKAFLNLKKNEKRLAHAQRLASMGSWELELRTDKMWFSDEVRQIFHFDPLGFDSSFQAFINAVHPVDRKRVEDATSNAINSNSSYSIDHQLLLCDGKSCFVHTEAAVITDQNGKPIRLEGAIQDITGRRAAEEEIRHLAYFDTLTGLPNRVLFLESLKRIHFKSERDGKRYAILFIDIDGFKSINDTLGHIHGDTLLQNLALRLKESIRVEDFSITGMVARLGGDEFVVIIDNLNNSEDVAIVAQRIIDNISIPVQLDASEVVVTASIGIGVFPDDSLDTDTLIKHADIAMYSAKDNGKNSFQYFNQSMHEAATFQLELEKELKMAITCNEFRMHYQPQVDLITKQIVGFESLIRWSNPKLGEVSPGVFIPLAEKNNLIYKIDQWVISEVCRQIRIWQDDGITDLQIAINLSGRSISSKDLVSFIHQEIQKNGIAPQSLQVEITEGLLMVDKAGSATTLSELKVIGISLAIDDFGTGYSSLQYLQRLPVDIIKIDQSFVSPISDVNERAPLVTAIIALARSLDLDVIAEGIERDVQSDFLSLHGCSMGQGYLFSRPVPAINVPSLLKQYQHKAGITGKTPYTHL
jgi:diguanylate cyclase (GGDEF)-like protein